LRKELPAAGTLDFAASVLEAQLSATQARLANETATCAALRRVAELLCEEREAALDKETCLVSALRLLELELAERPTSEELDALRQSCAAALSAAHASMKVLELELAALPDTLVCEQVEALTARIRRLECDLAERPEAPCAASFAPLPAKPYGSSVEDHLQRIEALLAIPVLSLARRKATFVLRRQNFPVAHRPAYYALNSPESTSAEAGISPAPPAISRPARGAFMLRRHVFR
jgi:hypothetical protein